MWVGVRGGLSRLSLGAWGSMIRQCERCGRDFRPARSDQRFCTTHCRVTMDGPPSAATSPDPAVRRLFDPSRDPDETVTPADWHPSDDPAWHRLDAHDTIRARRRWYENLRAPRVSGGHLPGA
jgi:hypothetical protein